ncbi:MAG: pirin family protein [Actinomycetota bacterium]
MTDLPDFHVLRAAARYETEGEGIRSRHCFSFGAHYDSGNIRFGSLLACNDELLAPGSGFPPHPHAGVVIVTWVVRGTLEHTDSTGRVALCRAGAVQVLRSGSGIEHAERNPGRGSCRMVQFWLDRAELGPPGHYTQVDLRSILRFGNPAPACLLPGGAILRVTRLQPDGQAALRDAPLVHLFVVRGSLSLSGLEADLGLLDEGDSVQLTQPGELSALAGKDGAEILVWALRS